MANRNEKGFTLLEVLVSMVIFSFGILGVLNMQLLSTTMNVKSRGMTEGVIAAQNKIEELSALDYDNALLLETVLDGVAGFNNTKEQVIDNADQSDLTDPRYELYWNVANNVPFPNTKKIRVVVRWLQKGVASTFEIYMTKTDGV